MVSQIGQPSESLSFQTVHFSCPLVLAYRGIYLGRNPCAFVGQKAWFVVRHVDRIYGRLVSLIVPSCAIVGADSLESVGHLEELHDGRIFGDFVGERVIELWHGRFRRRHLHQSTIIVFEVCDVAFAFAVGHSHFQLVVERDLLHASSMLCASSACVCERDACCTPDAREKGLITGKEMSTAGPFKSCGKRSLAPQRHRRDFPFPHTCCR